MKLPEQLTPTDLDQISIPGSHGRIAARLGVMATLYFAQPHEAWVRKRLGRAVDRLLALFRDRYRWRLDREKKRMVTIQGWVAPSYEAVFLATGRDEEVELELQGGEHPDDAAHFVLSCLANAWRPYTEIGYLTVSASFGWVTDHAPGAWQRLFLNICRDLKPLHGYGGLGILCNPDYVSGRKAEPFVVPLARRFPGLELDFPISHSLRVADGIKGINWLTALSDKLIERLGGKDALAAAATAAGQGLLWTPYEGGGVLQAGETPQLGDLERDLVPPAYVTANTLLRPVRAVYDSSILGERIPGIDHKQFTRNWLNRFEGGRP